MKTMIAVPAILLLASTTFADDRDAEINRLRNRINELEVENESLRGKLAKIAEIVSAKETEPSATLAISLASHDWGDAGQADILKVLHSSAMPIWTAAGKPPLHRISVRSDSDGPLVAYQRGPANDYRVLLNVRDRLWARMAYQFSHEMCHILANYREVPNPQLWFEESLCECASLYSLRAMGESWKTNPPYANWKSYAGSLTSYAEDRIDKTSVPEGNLAAWYEEHQETLDSTGTNRELNQVVAVKLLEIFEKHPRAWRTVRLINRGDAIENNSLSAYLAGWHSRVAAEDREVVREIAALFEIELTGE